MFVDTLDLAQQDYELIRRLVYVHSGINLGDGKMQLVKARLGKKVRQGNFHSFRDYYHHVEQDPTGDRLCELLDAISTNTTHLFREVRHFHLLQKLITHWAHDRDWRIQHTTLRIWSAACASGEEPHSLAMVAYDTLLNHPGIDLKILATDLSKRMISRATLALYKPNSVRTVPPDFRTKYLKKIERNGQVLFQLVPQLRKTITFARFNLMTPSFHFGLRFNVIFCRNVMIYFDRPTQEALVNKLAGQLQPGGYLMIGHSESLQGIHHPLSYVEPTVYRKTGSAVVEGMPKEPFPGQ